MGHSDYVKAQAAALSWEGILYAKPTCDRVEFALKQLGPFPPSTRILDCACGDGTSIYAMHVAGFTHIIGVELIEEKARRALLTERPILLADMHNLSCLPAASFDLIYSSHSLEHCYNPSLVMREWFRLLTPHGRLRLALPFEDASQYPEVHCGSHILGLVPPNANPDICRRLLRDAGFASDDPYFTRFNDYEIMIAATKE
jgi:SAM-dependent methyltransferase